ncbi:MAG: alpha/beta hydrolase [Acidobacteriota bacterium]
MTQSKYPRYTEGRLDPQSELVLDQMAAANAPPMVTLTPQESREQPFPAGWLGTPRQDVRIEKTTVPAGTHGIPIRIYTPTGAGPFPVLVFFHGGGFVAGALNDFDPFCTFLAEDAACIVVSVDYRLAPEHKYPAAVDDAMAALDWVRAHAGDFHGDRTRIAVAGDSAGGNLAAVVSLRAREHGAPSLLLQVLICPWVDSSSFDTDSFRFFGDGLWLSKEAMCWYRNHYLCSPGQAFDTHVSPILAEDLSGLPPALVITAEFDVLRDQAEVYARRLQASGIPVTCTRYPGMLHDFALYPGLFDQACAAIGEITAALRRAFARI